MNNARSFLDFINYLSDSVDNHSYCFILGSGASFSSGIPTGSELVTRWLRELYERRMGRPPIADNMLEDFAKNYLGGMENFEWNNRAEFYSKVFRLRFPTDTDPLIGQNALSNLMRGKNPSFGYSVVAKILAYTNHRVVITTNFDHLLEDSLHRYVYAIPQVITSDTQAQFALINKDAGPPVIMKIHGDNYFETKNTDSEIQVISQEWSKTIKTILARYTPIIIGYGGHDPGFMKLLQDIPEKHFKHPPFWCFYDNGEVPLK